MMILWRVEVFGFRKLAPVNISFHHILQIKCKFCSSLMFYCREMVLGLRKFIEIISFANLFSSSGTKGQLSFSNHLASFVVVVLFLHLKLYVRTTELNEAKHGKNVPYKVVTKCRYFEADP